MQEIARQVYENIDRWWPYDTVKATDAPHMVSSTGFHELLRAWPRPFGRMGIEKIDPVAVGVVRPIFGGWVEDEAFVRQAPLNMLLYVDSVVLDATLLEPAYFVRQGSVASTEQLTGSIRWLLTVRPLVESGAILFADRVPRDLFESDDLDRAIDRTPGSRAAIEAALPRGVASASSAVRILHANIDAAAAGRATPLATSRWQRLVYEAVLGRQPISNKRESRLGHLASFRVHDPQASWSDLVALRTSEAAYVAIRHAIARGFELVGDVPAGEDIRSVQAIVHDELYQSFRMLQATAETSAFRSAFRPVAKSLGWLGLGATATQALGTPVTAGPTVVSETMSALAKRKQARAIWSVVTAFGADIDDP